MRVVVIGLGGVGTILIERLSRYLNYSVKDRSELVLVDGDDYEFKNYERQEFIEIGKKAEIKSQEIKFRFPELIVEEIPYFIDTTNIDRVIKENDFVFLCVDNHKTRNIVSKFCKMLKNIVVISGGNEFTDGNIQIYIRKEGKDITPSLGEYHPEIENPQDKLPNEMSCEELSQTAPQLYFTNAWVALMMCTAFYNYLKNDLKYNEVYFDTKLMSTISHNRIVRKQS